MIGIDAREICIGRRECSKLLRRDTAEASTACETIQTEDELEIIEQIVDIQTCDILFQYSLVRLTGWLQPHTSRVV